MPLHRDESCNKAIERLETELKKLGDQGLPATFILIPTIPDEEIVVLTSNGHVEAEEDILPMFLGTAMSRMHFGEYPENPELEQALRMLYDELCQWERSTGREAVTFYIPTTMSEQVEVALNGVMVNNSGMSPAEILNRFLTGRQNRK